MRALTANEIQEVNGGEALDSALGLIGAIGGMAAIFSMPAAAAFAGGVVFGAYAVRALYDMTLPL